MIKKTILSYRYRLYPTKEQKELLQANLDACRWLYNYSLEQLGEGRDIARLYGWSSFRGIPSQYDLSAQLPVLKQRFPFLQKVNAKVLQRVLAQLYSNLKVLSSLKKNGRKIGKLRFKSKDRYKTLNFNQSGFKLNGKKLYLSKIGEVNIKSHRAVEGKIKGILVKRENSGKWFAIMQVEKPVESHKKTIKTAVGIDVGVNPFLTDTDGKQMENLEYYDKTAKRLKRLHRKLSRKKMGSKNRRKAKLKLAGCYEKLTNQRDDYLHKLSRFYVDTYDFIAVEDLDIPSIIHTYWYLARRILDASWGKFRNMLTYKAESAGRTVIPVDPEDTSRENPYNIPNRHYRAAINILERGLKKVGLDVPEFTPVERKPLLCVPASAVISGQVYSMKQERSPRL